MSLCLSASTAASPLEIGAFAPRPTPIARLRQLFRSEPAIADPQDALAETALPRPRAPVNVLLL